MKPSQDDDEGEFPHLGSRDADEFAPSPLPVGPDGQPKAIGPVGLPDPLPPATPDNWVCLRGPCRHYMHVVSAGEIGNPAGSFDKDNGGPGEAPRQHYHWCTAITGQYTDMGEDLVFDCNRWDPIDEDAPEILGRERRRSKYLKLHPEHAPITPEEAARLAAESEDEIPDFPEEMKHPPQAESTTGQGDDHAPGE